LLAVGDEAAPFGEELADLLADDELVAVIVLAAPGRRELRGA